MDYVDAHLTEYAITSAMTHCPDLILADVFLKRPMIGIQVVEAIRSQSRCPVICVTSHSDKLTLDIVKATEPFGRVLQPTDEEELRAALDVMCWRRGNLS